MWRRGLTYIWCAGPTTALGRGLQPPWLLPRIEWDVIVGRLGGDGNFGGPSEYTVAYGRISLEEPEVLASDCVVLDFFWDSWLAFNSWEG